MPIYTLKLISRREVARGVIEFIFDKPAGLRFLPGQYAGFTLIYPSETDAQGITRRFSLLSTPDQNHLSIATRIQNSAYKRVLNALSIGDVIKFAGPTGTFILHEDISIPAVFIAGGIGITPFYSMINDATQHQSPRKLFLFYGNQSLPDAAYFAELQSLQKQNSQFTFIPTMVNPDHSWQGETGFITDTMIKKYISHLNDPIYYICGSPAMVTVLQETLVEMGVNEDKIKVEDFPGY
ncbi:MAG: FAD-dependent oxidoreductase [Gammaproteobacteria bacterium]|nr:FAD-dependent oxidoreductase [Gammaproteobacteria bacterium]MCW5583983.1 FAD-dependent oxidoreductase [Gammaproteobacteria bacterium]